MTLAIPEADPQIWRVGDIIGRPSLPPRPSFTVPEAPEAKGRRLGESGGERPNEPVRPPARAKEPGYIWSRGRWMSFAGSTSTPAAQRAL